MAVLSGGCNTMSAVVVLVGFGASPRDIFKGGGINQTFKYCVARSQPSHWFEFQTHAAKGSGRCDPCSKPSAVVSEQPQDRHVSFWH